MELDVHLHTISSGHATSDTMTAMAQSAAAKNLKMIGFSDHGPATAGSAKPSYFRSLHNAPKRRWGVDILYGVELNILDYNGQIDLPDQILTGLDYGIISMHIANIRPGSAKENTAGYIEGMKHPNVKIIGHCDDNHYPVNYESLLAAAIKHGVVFEINNSSLSPEGYRGDTTANNRRILELCKKYNHPVLLASDSHGIDHIGNFQYAKALLNTISFPKHLILNYSSEQFLKIIRQK